MHFGQPCLTSQRACRLTREVHKNSPSSPQPVALAWMSPGAQGAVGEVTGCNRKPGTSWLLTVRGEGPDSPLGALALPPPSLPVLLTREARRERQTQCAPHRAEGISVALTCFYTPPTALLDFTQQRRWDFPPTSYSGREQPFS